jgi:hypothetical protein
MALVAVAIVLPSTGRADTKPQAPQKLLQRVAAVERTVPSGYGASIDMTGAPQGGVQIATWREQTIEIDARIELNAPSEEDLDRLSSIVGFTIEPLATGVVVKTTGPHDKALLKQLKGFPSRLEKMPWRIDYLVWVPEFTAVNLRVYDGDVSIEGVNGFINVACARGPITLRDLGGTVVAATGYGDVNVVSHQKSLRGGNLDAQTTNGNVFVTLPKGFMGVVDATAAGGIFLKGEKSQDLGFRIRQTLGVGGGVLTFVASGQVVVTVGTAPEKPPESPPEPPAAEPPGPAGDRP